MFSSLSNIVRTAAIVHQRLVLHLPVVVVQPAVQTVQSVTVRLVVVELLFVVSGFQMIAVGYEDDTAALLADAALLNPNAQVGLNEPVVWYSMAPYSEHSGSHAIPMCSESDFPWTTCGR